MGLLQLGDGGVQLLNLLGGCGLGKHQRGGTLGDNFFQILLAQAGVQGVDPHNGLAAKAHEGQGVADQNPGGILLLGGYRIFQIQNDSICAQSVAVDEHIGRVAREKQHGADHADSPLPLRMAVSTRARMTQSRAPRSMSVTLASFTP